MNMHDASPLAIDVGADDIDHMGHVNNSVYLRWIETAVHDHWKKVAGADNVDAYRWIAARHEIDYRSPAFEGEALTANTRLLRIRRARAWYATVISRDGRALVEAESCWCLLDAATGRLTAIPDDVAGLFGIAPRGEGAGA